MRRTPLKTRTSLRRKTPLKSTSVLTARTPLRKSQGRHARIKDTRPRNTGFSPAVKLKVRTRAGDGDPDDARCEATGVWLGRYGGEIQHRVARLSGGRGPKAPWWFNTAANAALLSKDAHRRAEAGDRHLIAAGFALDSTADATAEPIMLADTNDGGGVLAWLTPNGHYSPEPPRGAA
jgi:hypothetical protein